MRRREEKERGGGREGRREEQNWSASELSSDLLSSQWKQSELEELKLLSTCSRKFGFVPFTRTHSRQAQPVSASLFQTSNTLPHVLSSFSDLAPIARSSSSSPELPSLSHRYQSCSSSSSITQPLSTYH
jgi:hypothetical protein